MSELLLLKSMHSLQVCCCLKQINKLVGRRYRPNVDLPEPCMNSGNVCNMMYGQTTNNTRGDLTVDTDTWHSVTYRPYKL